MEKTMSIYAEALAFNRELKNGRINGKTVGIAEAHNWSVAVKSCLIPAYNVRKYRYDNMGKSEDVPACDMNKLYDAIRPVLNLIGEVNGDKLNAVNVAEEFVAQSIRFRVIDTSNEMAHARCELKSAREKRDNFEQGEMSKEEYASKYAELSKKYDECNVEVKRLEAIPGNCKRKPDIQSDSAFMKAIEIALGDAITKQTLRPTEEILAEKAAREADRKAKRKANKLSKKNAK